MTANYLAGKRILGESDKTVTTTGSFQGWKELGRTTLSSEADDITVSGLANKRYLMVLVHCTDTGQANCNIRFNFCQCIGLCQISLSDRASLKLVAFN